MFLSRRSWIKSVAGAAGLFSIGRRSRPTILVCSSWQTANIGDIAHTPGLLSLLRDQIPEAEIVLWPAHVLDRGARAMLHDAFPELRIVEGDVDSSGVTDAFSRADLFLHGSGPYVVGQQQIETWVERTRKPFGIFGVTLQTIPDPLSQLLDKASFVFTRETRSLQNLAASGVRGPVTDFAPDATFAFDLHNEAAAAALIKKTRLADGPVLCVIPRLRKTPYYSIYPERDWTDQKIREIDTLNDQFKEVDHAKLRHAIVRWIEQTDGWALICPEMTYQLDIMKPLVVDPLPVEVRSRIATVDRFWLPDEAASVYCLAAAVLSMECHSPILSCRAGTPGLYLRQPSDTIKGQMWYDLGFAEWVREIDEVSGETVAETLLAAVGPAADHLLKTNMELAAELHETAMLVVRQTLGV